MSELNPDGSFLEQKAQIEKAVERYRKQMLSDGALSSAHVKGLQNNIDLGVDSSLGITAVDVEASKRILALNEKAKNFTLGSTARLVGNSNISAADGYALEAAVADFIEMKATDGTWSDKTASQSKSILKLIVAAIGPNILIPDIRRKEAEDYRKVLLESGLGKATINKRLTLMGTMYKWLVLHEHTSMNPFLSLTVRSDTVDSERREGFTDEEVLKILGVANMNDNYKKWIPWLLIYTGCRINELCQLNKIDIYQKDGVWLIRITDDGPSQKLKNKASKRVVPVHSALIEKGFIEYVTARADGHLWDGLPPGRDGHMRNASKWMSTITKQLDIIGANGKNKTAHSCRHTVITKLIEAKASDRHMKALVGHAQGDMAGDVYFKGFEAQGLQGELEKLCYSML